MNILHCLASNTIKFRKYVPWLIFFQRTFSGGLSLEGLIYRGATEGNLCLGIDWAYNIIGGKFVSAIFKFANNNIGALTRNQ